MTDIAELVLAQDDIELQPDRSDDHRTIALTMATQASLTLDISSRHLDPGIYDSDAFSTAVRQLALRSHHSRIRLLVIDPAPIITHGHRLVNLAMQLSSFITIRKPGPDHKGFNEAWLIADKTGYVRRIFADRFESTANFNDRRTATDLTRRFDDIWERAELDPNLRRLGL